MLSHCFRKDDHQLFFFFLISFFFLAGGKVKEKGGQQKKIEFLQTESLRFKIKASCFPLCI